MGEEAGERGSRDRLLQMKEAMLGVPRLSPGAAEAVCVWCLNLLLHMLLPSFHVIMCVSNLYLLTKMHDNLFKETRANPTLKLGNCQIASSC